MVNLGPEFWDPLWSEPTPVGEVLKADKFLEELLGPVPVEQRYKVDPSPLPSNMAAPAKTVAEQELMSDDFTSKPVVYKSNCYICRDPEFAQMGLPLCRPCRKCIESGDIERGDGHIPADDTVCTVCEYDEMEDYDGTSSDPV